MDKLQEILSYYKDNLQDWEIELYAGRKGRQIHLSLDFNLDHLKHLMGLHKLRDMSYWANDSSSRLLNKIENGELTLDSISRSSQFPLIKSRFDCVFKIKDMVTNARQISKSRNGAFLGIDADYMLSSKDERLGNIHLFLKAKKDNKLIPVSIFNCNHNKYLEVPCSKWTILSKDKIENSSVEQQSKQNTKENKTTINSDNREQSVEQGNNHSKDYVRKTPQEQEKELILSNKVNSEAVRAVEDKQRQIQQAVQVKPAEQVRQVEQVGQSGQTKKVNNKNVRAK